MSDKEQTRPDFVWRLEGDAIEPKAAPWGFVAQNPFQRLIPPGQTIQIDTGIRATVPMLASPRGEQADYVSMPVLVPAGGKLVVTVQNKSAHTPLSVDDREPIANLHPLIFRGRAAVD